jgi:hypothetical protein
VKSHTSGISMVDHAGGATSCRLEEVGRQGGTDLGLVQQTEVMMCLYQHPR